ncbi:MAG: universal stress protein, partial [Kiritimatiellae bacterium]|nr:universal stress protein [Kiritimatiellia bacterium]
NAIIPAVKERGDAMIKNILFGVDGSAHGDVAREYAIDFALRLKAQIEAVHVVDSRMLDFPILAPQTGLIPWNPGVVNGLQDALRTRGEALLKETAERATAAGIALTTSLEFGHPAQIFGDIQARTELVVLGRQGEHAGAEFTGSTMERFIRRARRPCLVTPAEFQPVRKILVGTDGSPAAGRALHEAVELANGLEVPLVILAVAERESDLPLAQKNALEAHSLARAHECAAASITAVGAPALCLLDKAAETGCNLIALGSHGHGWMYDRLIGSAAAHVASRAPVPVLLVH